MPAFENAAIGRYIYDFNELTSSKFNCVPRCHILRVTGNPNEIKAMTAYERQ